MIYSGGTSTYHKDSKLSITYLPYYLIFYTLLTPLSSFGNFLKNYLIFYTLLTPLSSFGNFFKNVATYDECFTLMIYNLFEICMR